MIFHPDSRAGFRVFFYVPSDAMVSSGGQMKSFAQADEYAPIFLNMTESPTPIVAEKLFFSTSCSMHV